MNIMQLFRKKTDVNDIVPETTTDTAIPSKYMLLQEEIKKHKCCGCRALKVNSKGKLRCGGGNRKMRRMRYNCRTNIV